MTLTDRAATALDRTHFTNMGIRASQVRELLAAWLDGQKMRKSTVRRLVAYLEMIARS